MVRMPDDRLRAAKESAKVEGRARREHSDLEVGLTTLLAPERNVKAYALLTIEDEGKTVWHTSTSNHVKPYFDEKTLGLAASNLRKAHETAVLSPVIPNRYMSRNAVDVKLVAELDTADHEAHDLKTRTKRSHKPSEIRPGRPRKIPPFQLPSSVTQTNVMDDAPVDPIDDDDQPMPTISSMSSFYMHEEDKVKAYLLDRIERMHQLPDKKIAKVWIKGICPKKQANFPYQNKQREKELGLPPVIPAWWPPLNVCPFIEPDHVVRGERNQLLLHLLRIRPTPQQLKEWNTNGSGAGETNPTYKFQGWTAFLKELAPVECVDEIEPAMPERIAHRRKLLSDIYGVAQMEQDYKEEGMDSQFQYQDDQPKSVAGSKRSRRAASVATSVEDAAFSRCSSPSDAGSHAPSKRLRRESDAKVSAVHPKTGLAGQMSDFVIAEETMKEPGANLPTQIQNDVGMAMELDPLPTMPAAPRRRAAVPDQKPAVGHVASAPRRHLRHGLPTENARWHNGSESAAQGHDQAVVQRQHQWQQAATPSHNSSFGPTTAVELPAFDTYDAQMTGQSMFPANHSYAFPPAQYPTQLPQHQHMVQVRQVSQVPQPQFDTVPNTPTFSPGNLMYHDSNQAATMQDVAAMQATQPMMAQQQPAFAMPPEYAVDQLVAQGGLQYHQQAEQAQQYGMQHGEQRHHIGNGLRMDYPPADTAQIQYGGLPIHYMPQQHPVPGSWPQEMPV